MADSFKSLPLSGKPAPSYAEEALRLANDLPQRIRESWSEACETDVVVENEGVKGRKPRKPTALLAPASKCMIVSSALRLIPMGAGLSPPVLVFDELIEQANIERLLAGPLGHMGMITQVVILRGTAAMAERALGADVTHIWRAVRRIRKRARRVIRPGRQRRYEDYWDVALELAPYAEPGDVHDVETALQSRHAATLGVSLEMALRRYELAGLKLKNVIIDDRTGVVDIVVPAALRKAGDSFQHRLSPTMAELMIDYVRLARPFLIAGSGGVETDWLWISRKGGRLCPAGVVSTLRRQVESILGVTASCNIFRRANASRGDIREAEMFLYLQQSRGSVVGQEIYAERDRSEAQQTLLAEWERVVA